MLGLTISCSSKYMVTRVRPVRIKKFNIGGVGCMGDEKRGDCTCYVDFLYYNLQLTFIPFYVHFICFSSFYVWPWCH